MERIAILGLISAGKTTLAAELSRRLNIPHIEVDAIANGPNWTPTPPEVLLHQLEEKMRCPRWIMDGDRPSVREQVLAQADTLIWLDYPLWFIWGRVTLRTLRRVRHKELLWGINTERASMLISFPALALQNYLKYYRGYPAAFRQPAYRHLQFIRLRSPEATQAWLAGIPTSIQAP